jgi:hypothetical protein
VKRTDIEFEIKEKEMYHCNVCIDKVCNLGISYYTTCPIQEDIENLEKKLLTVD